MRCIVRKVCRIGALFAMRYWLSRTLHIMIVMLLKKVETRDILVQEVGQILSRAESPWTEGNLLFVAPRWKNTRLRRGNATKRDAWQWHRLATRMTTHVVPVIVSEWQPNKPCRWHDTCRYVHTVTLVMCDKRISTQVELWLCGRLNDYYHVADNRR